MQLKCIDQFLFSLINEGFTYLIQLSISDVSITFTSLQDKEIIHGFGFSLILARLLFYFVHIGLIRYFYRMRENS